MKRKFKSSIRVLDSGALRGECTCGWVGNALGQNRGVDLAIKSVNREIEEHEHLPQPKKGKK
jgi:hypothetical protein